MINKISSLLDSIANRLEDAGLYKEAYDIDVLSNTIDTEYDRIEKQLEDAYRRHAPQSQIDHLETELAKYVNEGDLNMSEEDMIGDEPMTSEGFSIDEELIALYHQYLHPEKSIYDRDELVNMMYHAFAGESSVIHGQYPLKSSTKEQALEAAKDAYENYMALKRRRSNPNRMNRTPEEALKDLDRIKKHFKK